MPGPQAWLHRVPTSPTLPPGPAADQVTSRYGTEETKATVDFTLYDPLGRTLHFEESVGSSEVAMTGSGGRGPWRACFKVSRRQILRPSVIVRLSYFTVNSPTLIGTHFEWQRGQHADAGATKPDAAAALAASEVKPEQLGTAEQVTALMEGLQRLDFYLHNVTNEQRYLSSRSDRHLRTVRSTHARALWYNLAVYAAIVLAAFAQVRRGAVFLGRPRGLLHGRGGLSCGLGVEGREAQSAPAGWPRLEGGFRGPCTSDRVPSCTAATVGRHSPLPATLSLRQTVCRAATPIAGGGHAAHVPEPAEAGHHHLNVCRAEPGTWAGLRPRLGGPTSKAWVRPGKRGSSLRAAPPAAGLRPACRAGLVFR